MVEGVVSREACTNARAGSEAIAQAGAAAIRLREAGARFVAVCRELADAAGDLVAAEQSWQTAASSAAISRDGVASSRELAVDVVLHAARALRPFIPLATHESAERSEEALTTFGVERKAGFRPWEDR
jgi:hypothetical protein